MKYYMNDEQSQVQVSGLQPIIMVDDSDIDFHIAELMYKKSQLPSPLIHCKSGQALLNYLEANQADGVPPVSVILMDINMPGMNGIETVAAVRALPSYSEIPIIAMLSSSFDSSDRQRAEKVGANSFFNKPMDPNEYIAIFKELAEFSTPAADNAT